MSERMRVGLVAGVDSTSRPPLEKGGTGGICLCQFLLLAALLFLFTACSSVPFKPTELTPVQPTTSAALSEVLWSKAAGKLLIRQSAVFELLGMKFPVTGLMQLDSAAGTARLVGMNDMGVKLYDISIGRDSSRANYVIPELSRYPAFSDAVATSVRRIFLEPQPAAGDAMKLTSDSYLLSRRTGDCELTFVFGGADRQLLEKSCSGKASWQVRYYQYGRVQGILVPGGIVLDDNRAGYRLTLWTESVEKADE